jgi:hypothetical protein
MDNYTIVKEILKENVVKITILTSLIVGLWIINNYVFVYTGCAC